MENRYKAPGWSGPRLTVTALRPVVGDVVRVFNQNENEQITRHTLWKSAGSPVTFDQPLGLYQFRFTGFLLHCYQWWRWRDQDQYARHLWYWMQIQTDYPDFTPTNITGMDLVAVSCALEAWRQEQRPINFYYYFL